LSDEHWDFSVVRHYSMVYIYFGKFRVEDLFMLVGRLERENCVIRDDLLLSVSMILQIVP
jgi:hypothetical protein